MKRRVFPFVLAVGAMVWSAGSVVAAVPGVAPQPAIVGRTLLPQISAAFSAAQAPISAQVTASFSIKNPDASHTRTSVNVAVFFSVVLPSSAPRTICGGTLTTSGNSVSLLGATISPSATCTVGGIGIPTSQPGVIQLQSSNVKSDVADGNSTTASMDVFQLPTISAGFKPASITTGSATVLTFTVTNPAANAFALASIGLGSTLPAGTTAPNGTWAAGSCGGTLTITGHLQVGVTGWTLPVKGSCQVSVSVTGGHAGTFQPSAALNQAGKALAGSASATLTVTTPAPTATPVPTATETLAESSSLSAVPSASASPTAAALAATASASVAPTIGPVAAVTSGGDGPGMLLLLLAGAVIGAAAVLAVGGLIAAFWMRRRRTAIQPDRSPEPDQEPGVPQT